MAVKNYKSIASISVQIGSLTVLAGANNAGKSSLLQPLLLLKQTLETASLPFDSTINFNGNNVSLTSFEQIQSKIAEAPDDIEILVGSDNRDVTLSCRRNRNFLEVTGNRFCFKDKDNYTLDLFQQMPEDTLRKSALDLSQKVGVSFPDAVNFRIENDRCFFGIRPFHKDRPDIQLSAYQPYGRLSTDILSVLHIQGLRCQAANRESVWYNFPEFPDTENPEYMVPGLFPEFTASIIYAWKQENNGRFARLQRDIRYTGLTNKVSARPNAAGDLEIIVAWDPNKENPPESEMVNIADVGIGVSQALPIVVALISASPGQIVYVEQPSIHLHPKAIIAIANVIVDAVRRGVRVIVETHSELFVLAIQIAVARRTNESGLNPEGVLLYWVEKITNSDEGIVGSTKITDGRLDSSGNYKNWPSDFNEIEMAKQMEFIEARLPWEERMEAGQ